MIKTYAYKDIQIDEIFAREEEKSTVADVVAEIIADVRKNGDKALKAYCEKFDGAKLNSLAVTEEFSAFGAGPVLDISGSFASCRDCRGMDQRVSLRRDVFCPFM